MHWYVGGIAEAVATSKSRNAIFVVYVEGKDEKSVNLTSVINTTEISQKLETTNFVALKLEAGSTPHNQFAEIYKNVPVPSMFFIGKTGQPLDIVTDISSAHDLSDRIDKVIQLHGGVVPKTAAAQSDSFIQQEQAVSSANVAPPTVVTSPTVVTPLPSEAISEPATEEPSSVATTSEKNEGATEENHNESETDKTSDESVEEDKSLTKEEKVQRAKDLVEQKRVQKQMEEEQKEKDKELERRKLGQEVQKMKQWQRDQELKELMEKRKKEKNEDKMARDRILAQIAQDKADRAARFGGNSPSSPVASEPKVCEPAKVGVQANTARLQFKLPDGSTDTNTFESTATLQEVRNYITSNLNIRSFTLSTTFPRREFTSEHYPLTLSELELCPTAVVLVLAGNGRVTLDRQYNGPFGLLSSLLWLILSPVTTIYGYFRHWFTGGEPTNDNKRTAEDQPATSSKRRQTESTTVRRQGNIARLTDHNDSDDDNNTWNGNSTQQM